MSARKGDTAAPPIIRLTRSSVVDQNGCWVWTRAKRQGYGIFGIAGKVVSTHRFAYEFFVGEIPEGLHLDHLCRNRACWNFLHLEPVTCKVNYHRSPVGNAVKTHCPKGHPYNYSWTDDQGYSHRLCQKCRADKIAAGDMIVRAEMHGTLTGYTYGCRCEPCTESNRARARRAYHRKKAERLATEQQAAA